MTLLATAAFHLSGANFGRRLYLRAKDASHNPLFAELNEDPTTVEVAATVLVTTSCVSTVDLCCASIARFAGHVTGELDQTKKEWGFGKWLPPRRTQEHANWAARMAALNESAPSLHVWISDLLPTTIGSISTRFATGSCTSGGAATSLSAPDRLAVPLHHLRSRDPR